MTRNYNIIKKLVCGEVREMVLMPTYDGATPELWQEMVDNKDAYYVYSYGRVEGGEFKHRYIGIGDFDRYKKAKRHNNTLMGSIRNNPYHKIVIAKCESRNGAAEIEKNLISFLGRKDLGTGDLYNLSDGGEYGAAGAVRSEETKRKISEANKGKTLSEEHKRRLSEVHKGRTFSEETRRKLSEVQKGRNFSEETRKKMSEAQKGRTGENSSAWKSRDHITDEVLFQHLQS